MGEVTRRFEVPRPIVAPRIEADCSSRVVHWIRQQGGELAGGGLTLRLARELGFCFGVERAVRMAYETRLRFPDRRIFLTSPIVHNPSVHRHLAGLGIELLNGETPAPGDVVILPAFGAPLELVDRLERSGARLVDTTCGAVMNVWNRVRRFADEGITAIIHGKPEHEETRATLSRCGKFAVVRDLAEARALARHIERLAPPPALPCSDPVDFERLGLANQTTMLSSESMQIQRVLRAAVVRRDGGADRFLAFDTTCSATQDRQDAMRDLKADLTIVVGGFESSNTGHLADLSRRRGLPTYHVEDAAGISRERLRHRRGVSEDWWPERRPLVVALTSGASTPDRTLGEVILRLADLGNLQLPAGL